MGKIEGHEQAISDETESLGQGLWACIAGSGMMRASGAGLILLLQFYQAKIGMPPQYVGLISVAFYLTELAGAPIFGVLTDRRGWRPFILAGPLFSAAATILTWGTTFLSMTLVLPLLLVTRLLTGVGIASNVPATLSFISAASGTNPARRARAVGYFELATIGGTASGGLLGSVLYNYLGTTGFIALAFFYVLCWAIFLKIPGTLPGHKLQSPTSGHNPLRVLRQGTLWAFAPAWIAVNGILGIWINNFANQLALPCTNPPPETAARIADLCGRIGGQFLVGDFDITSVGAIFTGFALFFSFGILIWTRILSRMRQSKAMFIALGGSLSVSGLVFLINRAATGQTLFIVGVSVLICIGLIVMSGFTPAALTILVDLAEKNAEDRGTIMGTYSVLLGVGQFLGGALGGLLAAALGVDGMALLTLIFTLTAGVFVYVYSRSEVPH